MSSSRRREEIAVGVGESEERVRRILPSELMNLRRLAGLREGPRPGGRERVSGVFGRKRKRA